MNHIKKHFRYEHHSEPLLSRALYLRRIFWHGLVASSIVIIALTLGIFGYHFIEGLAWIDALVNASMLLGGMGPVNELNTNAGKLFASFYALFSGIVFLVIAGILLAPTAHRLLHRLHLDSD